MNALLRPVLTFEERPTDPDGVRYVRAFLAQRLFIGGLGVALPFILVGFGWWIDGHPIPRNSLSVYYYSGVGAVFVGVLTTVAFFLIAYRLVELKNFENLLSLLAGLAVLLVVLFPTKRPDATIDPTPLQRQSESFVYAIHLGAAVAFIVLIGFISFFFGARERDRHRKHPGSGRIWWFHWVCTGAIWLGGLWILFALKVIDGPRWSVFAGEFAAFFAFGVSWLTKGAELDALLGRKPSRESLGA